MKIGTVNRYVDELSMLIPEFISKIRVHEAERLNSYGITPSQYFTLFLLQDEGPCMLKNLGEKLNIAMPTVSGIVLRLDRDGMVEKTASSNDRRVVLVGITRKGQRLLEDIRRNRMEQLSKRLQEFPPEEIEIFFKVLQRIVGLLES